MKFGPPSRIGAAVARFAALSGERCPIRKIFARATGKLKLALRSPPGLTKRERRQNFGQSQPDFRQIFF